MATVLRWSGVETKALRQAMRLSVRDFAAHLDVGVRTVARWESRGAAITLMPDSQSLLDTALARVPDEIRQRFADAVVAAEDIAKPSAATEPNPPPSPDRRAFLKAGLSATIWSALNPDEQTHIAAVLESPRHNMDGAVVEYLDRQLRTYMASDGTQGPAKTLPAVLGLVVTIEQSARDVRPDLRRQLLAVGARVAEFVAWLYRDAHDPLRASFWRDRATEWAQEAVDPAMQGYVLLKKAQAAYDERDALRMFTLSEAVRSGPWQLPTKVRAEAAQQEARGHAMLGHAQAVVERNLDEARQLLTDASADEPNHLGGHYNATLLRMQTAICHTEAGQPRRAAELYRQWLQTEQFSPRDYGYFCSLMASALALAGEPEEAARVGLVSWPLAVETNSGRTKAELLKVLTTLRPWQGRTAVRELGEVVRA